MSQNVEPLLLKLNVRLNIRMYFISCIIFNFLLLFSVCVYNVKTLVFSQFNFDWICTEISDHFYNHLPFVKMSFLSLLRILSSWY